MDVGFGHRVYHPKPFDDTLLLPLCGLLLVLFPANTDRELLEILREHLATDMRDKELSYWTCRGENKAGFFVAEVDGEIAGTVCYVIEEDGEIEMFRMSADKKFRGRGAGSRLLLKIEETARRLNIKKVRFNTSAAQEPAVALYTKRGYNLVRKS